MHPDTSPTPRTDEARHMAFDVHNGDYNAYVYIYTANHGETLECELAEKTNEVARLREELKERIETQNTFAMALLEKPERDVARLRETLELIAAPMRPDGTYNRDRRACELLAKEALATEPKELVSEGTRIAAEARSACNELTEEERKRYASLADKVKWIRKRKK